MQRLLKPSSDSKAIEKETIPKPLSEETYLQTLKERNEQLAKLISHDLKINTKITNSSNLRMWLQRQLVINMRHVCQSFHRGGLYYDADSSHPLYKHYAKDNSNLTTESDLMPLVVVTRPNHNKTHLKVNRSTYMLKNNLKKGNTPSTVLSRFLFTRTAFDCLGATNLAFTLTLSDLLKTIHGEQEGEKQLNALLETNQNNLSRLLLGSLSINNLHEASIEKYFHQFEGTSIKIIHITAIQSMSQIKNFPEKYLPTPVTQKKYYEYLNNQSLISYQQLTLFFASKNSQGEPLYYGEKPLTTLEELIESPKKYLGMLISITGHPHYFKKHPRGFSQGWNLIFAGLNTHNEPLFLGAFGVGQKYLLTYQEVINVLKNSFNQFPNKNNFDGKQIALASKTDMRGISPRSVIFFDVDKIIQLLENFEETKKHARTHTDTVYSKKIVSHDIERVLTTDEFDIEKDQKLFISKNIIKRTMDDCDYQTLKFFRPRWVRDETKLTVKDDIDLPAFKS